MIGPNLLKTLTLLYHQKQHKQPTILWKLSHRADKNKIFIGDANTIEEQTQIHPQCST